jgi:hypothetical protein
MLLVVDEALLDLLAEPGDRTIRIFIEVSTR